MLDRCAHLARDVAASHHRPEQVPRGRFRHRKLSLFNGNRIGPLDPSVVEGAPPRHMGPPTRRHVPIEIRHLELV